MTLEQLFSKSYLLDPRPPYESKLYVPLLIFFGLLVLLGLITRLFARNPDKIIRRFYLAFFYCGILGLFYLFGRYERLPWIGSRVTLLSIAVILFAWIILNVISALRFYPRYNQEKKQVERFEKYLPKPRKA